MDRIISWLKCFFHDHDWVKQKGMRLKCSRCSMVAIKVCPLKDLETAEPEYFLDDNDIVWAYWGKEK